MIALTIACISLAGVALFWPEAKLEVAPLGYLHFVVNRAEWLMDVYRAEDNVAQHREVSRSS